MDGLLEISEGERKIRFAITKIQPILLNPELYREVLHCVGAEAQALLDGFQWLLDRPQVELDPAFRVHLVVATQRLSNRSGLFPTCYELPPNVVEGDQFPVEAGGFADIYKGICEGQAVCLKAMRVYQNLGIEYVLKRIYHESIIWGQLAHNNVLPFFGLFRFNNRLCFVSPWMEAGDVRTYVTSNPNVDRLQLVHDVTEGLQYLHNKGIVHGDLKGPNILVDDEGRARLADFGLSAMLDPQILAWTSTSSTGSKGGTVRWQAPELFDPENDAVVKNTKASDIYAWACVCFEIFTGTLPFADIRHDTTIQLEIMKGARPAKPTDDSPSWGKWGLTPALWALMEDCWKQKPEDRPLLPHILDVVKSIQTSTPRTPSRFNPSIRFRQRMNNVMDLDEVSAILDRIVSQTFNNMSYERMNTSSAVAIRGKRKLDIIDLDSSSSKRRVAFEKALYSAMMGR